MATLLERLTGINLKDSTKQLKESTEIAPKFIKSIQTLILEDIKKKLHTEISNMLNSSNLNSTIEDMYDTNISKCIDYVNELLNTINKLSEDDFAIDYNLSIRAKLNYHKLLLGDIIEVNKNPALKNAFDILINKTDITKYDAMNSIKKLIDALNKESINYAEISKAIILNLESVERKVRTAIDSME